MYPKHETLLQLVNTIYTIPISSLIDILPIFMSISICCVFCFLYTYTFINTLFVTYMVYEEEDIQVYRHVTK